MFLYDIISCPVILSHVRSRIVLWLLISIILRGLVAQVNTVYNMTTFFTKPKLNDNDLQNHIYNQLAYNMLLFII